MTLRANDPRELLKKALAALDAADPPANDEEQRQVDDATIEEWAERQAERSRARRRR